MILSVDVAHGLHPNYAGKMDLTNKPVLGKGFCIKKHAPVLCNRLWCGRSDPADL